jgi:hypothetical protein
VTVLLGVNVVTTLTFDQKIKNCDVGAGKEQLELVYRRERTSISLVPQVKDLKTNMTCFMENGKIFVFNLKMSNTPHKNIVVKESTNVVKGGTLILETSDFKLFDAGKNFYIENKKKEKILVNEVSINRWGYVSKWIPIVIDGKEYYL